MEYKKCDMNGQCNVDAHIVKRVFHFGIIGLFNCLLLTFSLFKIVNWLKVSSRFGLIVSVIRHVVGQSWSFVLIFVIN